MIKCQKCGWDNKDNAAACVNCFANLQNANVGVGQQQSQQPQPTQYSPQQPQQPIPPAYQPPQAQYGYNPVVYYMYAGFWIRFLACFIDGIILFVIESAVKLALGQPVIPTPGSAQTSTFGPANGINFLLSLAYMIGLNAAYGATPGKMALGLKIIKTDGSKIGFGTACIRYILQSVFAVVTCGLAYIAVATNDKKQGWHDKIADTYVVYDK